MKKYAVYPGYIISMNDKQLHYITAYELMQLYKVSPDECVIVDRNDPKKYLGVDLSKLQKLEPSYSGNYNL